ncbi:unnamed protein product, partial [Closterium sp. NIES-53]
YIIFATHMKQLGELASIYPNCKVCYFSVGVSNERLAYKESRRLEIGYSKFTALRRDYVVAQRLLCLQQSNLSDSELKDYLLKLKASYLDGTLV